jgi:hypothetical protein
VPFVPIEANGGCNALKSMSLIELKCSSIPTAPTNHLPDGWTLNKNTPGQKGADKANDPVLCVCPAARLTAGFTGLEIQHGIS